MNLSPHFTLAELCRSATAYARGVDNTPPAETIGNLVVLAQTALEPLRTLWGCPIKTTSGFRCLEVNQAVGGAKGSAHLDGRAADLIPSGLSLDKAYEMAAESPIPYDQLIIEQTSGGVCWIHVAIARAGEVPRRQALSAKGVKGKMKYNQGRITQRVAPG